MSNNKHEKETPHNYLYKTLENTTCYSCPKVDDYYPDFRRGVNCLCNTTIQNSSTELGCLGKSVGKWPISNNKLGWKL